jgi:hypothetical protein
VLVRRCFVVVSLWFSYFFVFLVTFFVMFICCFVVSVLLGIRPLQVVGASRGRLRPHEYSFYFLSLRVVGGSLTQPSFIPSIRGRGMGNPPGAYRDARVESWVPRVVRSYTVVCCCSGRLNSMVPSIVISYL